MTEPEVVAKYVGLVKWTAARRVPRGDYEDACQDGLLGVVQAHRKFDPDLGGGWYDRWMCLAVERSIIDGQRTRTQWRRVAKPFVVSLETVIKDDYEEDPLRLSDTVASRDTADGTVLADDLESWLRTLPLDPVHRRVLDGMLDGTPLQDIAAAEGVSPSRISQRAHYIREVVAHQIRNL